MCLAIQASHLIHTEWVAHLCSIGLVICTGREYRLGSIFIITAVEREVVSVIKLSLLIWGCLCADWDCLGDLDIFYLGLVLDANLASR